MRVKQLFKGHRELILGFNTFLPKVGEHPPVQLRRLHGCVCPPPGMRLLTTDPTYSGL